MADNSPSMMVPALIAGGVLGFLSGLPISSCACCLWAAGAGFFAAFLYSRSCRSSGAAFDAGKGAILGLFTGAIFGVVGGGLSSAISLATGSFSVAEMREAIDASPLISDPEAAEQAIQFFESVGPLFLILILALLWIVLGVVLAALGGLVGGMAFKVEQAPSATGGGWTTQPPAPPSNPPPPPVDPSI